MQRSVTTVNFSETKLRGKPSVLSRKQLPLRRTAMDKSQWQLFVGQGTSA